MCVSLLGAKCLEEVLHCHLAKGDLGKLFSRDYELSDLVVGLVLWLVWLASCSFGCCNLLVCLTFMFIYIFLYECLLLEYARVDVHAYVHPTF